VERYARTNTKLNALTTDATGGSETAKPFFFVMGLKLSIVSTIFFRHGFEVVNRQYFKIGKEVTIHNYSMP
jgi:hypothetical protein